jgi:hypothetical protein
MTYHRFLAYLFDRELTRELAIELAAVIQSRTSQERTPLI